MAYVRVYDPKTNEPFDVPEHKADELRLQHGWNTHPYEVTPVPAPVPIPDPIIEDVEKVFSRGRRRPVVPDPE